jgi:hypothetical protein
MSWHKPSAENTPLHPLSPSSIHLQPSLSNSYEQGRTLELQRERSEEGSGGGNEGEEEHQHPPMDLINIFNLIIVSSRDNSYFVDFPQKSNLWILMEAWRSLARGGSITC